MTQSWKAPDRITAENMRETLARLAAPFHPDLIEWRVGATNKEGGRGMALCYIDARVVRQRLNEVVGPWNWQSRHRIDGQQIICEIEIRVDGEWIRKSDGAHRGAVESSGKPDAKEEQRLDMEGKGAFSTAFKRTAVAWGIGEYLYDLDSPWVEIDKFKQITSEAMAKLRPIAGAPYKKWMDRLAEKGQGAGHAPPVPPAASSSAGTTADPAQAPPPATPPPASAPAPGDVLPDTRAQVDAIIRSLEEAQSGDVVIAAAEDLSSLNLAKTSPERKRAMEVFRKACDRLGVNLSGLKLKNNAAAQGAAHTTTQ